MRHTLTSLAHSARLALHCVFVLVPMYALFTLILAFADPEDWID